MQFATEMHEGQTRKHGNTPYIVHPVRVATLCLRHASALSPDRHLELAQVALLHDTIEDTSATAAELESRFGPRVRTAVQILTKPDGLPKDESDRLMLEQLERGTPLTRIVKLADRFDNLSDALQTFSEGHLRRYTETARLIHAVCRADCPPLAGALLSLIERCEGT